jgi:hypothetical protein
MKYKVIDVSSAGAEDITETLNQWYGKGYVVVAPLGTRYVILVHDRRVEEG